MIDSIKKGALQLLNPQNNVVREKPAEEKSNEVVNPFAGAAAITQALEQASGPSMRRCSARFGEMVNTRLSEAEMADLDALGEVLSLCAEGRSSDAESLFRDQQRDAARKLQATQPQMWEAVESLVRDVAPASHESLDAARHGIALSIASALHKGAKS